MELIADDVVTNVKGDKVYTKNGRVCRADIIVLATGFKVRDCEFARTAPSLVSRRTRRLPLTLPRLPDTVLFPLKIYNDKGESLQDRLNANGIKTYQSTLVAEFPNFVRRFRLCPHDRRLTAVSPAR